MILNQPLRLVPEYREYVWGGERLRPGKLTAEAWVLHEGNHIADGEYAGRTLSEICIQDAEGLLGRKVARRTGGRFPLLIKLLDCAQWLSLQVHPNDAQAHALEGAGQNGKTEAWHILQAEPQAQIIAGLRQAVSAAALAQAVRSGGMRDLVQFLPVGEGDTVFMPAGTIHALGPGMLVYEVQQSSDITYRVYDWDRPLTAGRALHIEKSLAVADPAAVGQVVPLLRKSNRQTLAYCAYFTLEHLSLQAETTFNTGGESFHALTVIEGAVDLVTSGAVCRLNRFDTALVPASCGAYRLNPNPSTRVLLAKAG